mgnify:CR=1 FL=1
MHMHMHMRMHMHTQGTHAPRTHATSHRHIPPRGYSLQATHLANYSDSRLQGAQEPYPYLATPPPPPQARIARATARKPVRLLIPVGGAGAQRTFVSKFVRATGALLRPPLTLTLATGALVSRAIVSVASGAWP